MKLFETEERVEGQGTIIELWMIHNSSIWSPKLCCDEENWSVGGLFEVVMRIEGQGTTSLSIRHHKSSSKLSDCCDRRRRNPNTRANLLILTIFKFFELFYTCACVWVHKDWRRMSKIYYTKQGGGVNLEIWPSVTISGQAALQTPPSLPPTHPPSKTWVREQIFYKQKTNLRFSFDLPV